MRRTARTLTWAGAAATAVAVSALSWAAPVQADPAAGSGSASAAPQAFDPSEAAAKWLQQQYGLSSAQAVERVATQHALTTTARRLTTTLGTDAAGSYIDQRTGKLVVNVTDPADAASVRAAGAVTKTVQFTTTALTQVKSGLDDAADTSTAGNVHSWYLDPRTDSVVVSVPANANDRATQAFLAKARAAGDKVTIRPAHGIVTTQEDLLGGQEVEMDTGYICSTGFNAVNAWGHDVFLTAGHCTRDLPTFSRNGTVLGEATRSAFPGDDFGAVRIDNEEAWNPLPVVDGYDSSDVTVSGDSIEQPGAAICKSGRTTGWTCGEVNALDVTVNYQGDGVVHGLTQHNACTEPGDSGGSNISGTLAQGLTSGGAGINGRCLEVYGYENESFIQPVGEALDRYGFTLKTG